MIIRRRFGRPNKTRTIGNIGRKLLASNTAHLRRMTISRQPAPSSINNDAEFTSDFTTDLQRSPLETTAPAARTAASPQASQQDLANSEAPSRALPPALQELFERSAHESFMPEIRRRIEERNKQTDVERYAPPVKPRPSNVKYEPAAQSNVNRQLDNQDFGQEPVFVERRTRAQFDYVNVSSPDKPKASDSAIQRAFDEAASSEADYEDDLPDALPGTFTVDDDNPSEASNQASINHEDASPKASAPAPLDFNTTSDSSERAQSQGPMQPNIQRSVADEIDGWVDDEHDTVFPELDYAQNEPSVDASDVASDSSETPSINADPGSDSLPIQRTSAPEIQPKSLKDFEGTDIDTSRRDRSEAPQPTVSADAIQRTADVADATPTPSNIQRSNVPNSSPADNIQRDVDAEVQQWQHDAPTSDTPPLISASDQPSDLSAPTPSPNSDDTASDLSNVDAVQPTPDVADATPTPSNIQRSNVPNSSPADNIQRDVDAEVQQWQHDAPTSDTPPLISASDQPSDLSAPTPSPNSDDTASDLSNVDAIQRTPDVADVAPTPPIQRSNVPNSSPVDNIQRDVDAEVQQWQHDAPTSDTPPLISASDQPSDLSAPTPSPSSDNTASDLSNVDAVQPTPDVADVAPTPLIQRSNVPNSSPADNIQRDVDAEVQQWQHDAPTSDTPPLISASDQITGSTELPFDTSDSDIMPSSTDAPVASSNASIVQRTPDVADVAPTPPIQRSNVPSPSPVHDIQRDVDSEVQQWRQDTSDVDMPLLQSAPTQLEDNSTEFINVPSDNDGSIDSSSNTSDARLIQRDVDSEVQQWQQNMMNEDAIPLESVPSVKESNSVAAPQSNATDSQSSAPVSVQRSETTDITPQQSNAARSATIQRSVEPDTRPNLQIQRQTLTPAAPPDITTRTQSSVNETSLPTTQQATYIQRAVSDEIDRWQADSYTPMPAANDEGVSPEWEIASVPTEATTLDLNSGQVAPISNHAGVQRNVDTDPTDTTPTVAPQANAHDQLPTQSIPLEEALFGRSSKGTSSIQRQPNPNYSDMLDLMNLPADTPIDDGPKVTISKKSSPEKTNSSDAIQRAEVSPPLNTAVSSDMDVDDTTDADASDTIEKQAQKMAEEIYRILQRRFRTDIERKYGNRRR